MTMKLFPVVLCGGSGTRLWPLSREHYPKQLLNLTGDETLLQATISRLDGLNLNSEDRSDDGLGQSLIVSNEAHRFLVAEQLRKANLPSSTIILEPVGRNTAPALCLATEYLVSRFGDGLMLVMPADHIICNNAAFHEVIAQGIPLAETDRLVTFGIVPTRAETGYGYIKKGVPLDQQSQGTYQIMSFVEKPDTKTAEQFWRSEQYLWNSGMFLFKASTWLAAIQRYRPDIAEASHQSIEQGKADDDFFRVNKQAFVNCPSESIDYAVMEKLTRDAGQDGSLLGAVIPLDAGWSDVGSWQNLWEVREKDEHDNVIQGDVYLKDTTGSMIIASHRVVTTIGLDNIVVVETPDAVLVVDKNQTQEVKSIVAQLNKAGRSETLTHRRVSRPWGSYEGVDAGTRFQVKRIIVNPQARLSLQMHHHRAEHWIVVKGTAKVTRGDEEFLLSENESTYIPLGVVHRLANPGSIPLEIIEVQSGSYLGEDDIVRYHDQYGRTEQSDQN